MSDMIDLFRALKEQRRKEREQLVEENMQVIEREGIPYLLGRGQNTLAFRNADGPKVDFYLSSGKWKYMPPKGDPQYLHGGAEKFVQWYREKVGR